MFAYEWEILIVDDDEDVLQLSVLALKKVKVYGAPLRIHTARSKAEALALFNQELMMQGGYNALTVALIDVVMETDTAGLELCEALRKADPNNYTQLYVRTGQPGVAPERAVIDRYEINGYFSKNEMSEDKLYSLVTAGIRQSAYMAASSTLAKLQTVLIEMNRSRAGMTAVLNQIIQTLETTATGKTTDTFRLDMAFMAGDDVIAGRDEVKPVKARLQSQPGVVVNEAGDRYVIEGKQLLIHVPESGTTADFSLAIDSSSEIAVVQLPVYCNFARSLAALWKQSNPALVDVT
jgi:CheY-like chemotaxis protein